jgi:hypothetical protein
MLLSKLGGTAQFENKLGIRFWGAAVAWWELFSREATHALIAHQSAHAVSEESHILV